MEEKRKKRVYLDPPKSFMLLHMLRRFNKADRKFIGSVYAWERKLKLGTPDPIFRMLVRLLEDEGCMVLDSISDRGTRQYRLKIKPLCNFIESTEIHRMVYAFENEVDYIMPRILG